MSIEYAYVFPFFTNATTGVDYVLLRDQRTVNHSAVTRMLDSIDDADAACISSRADNDKTVVDQTSGLLVTDENLDDWSGPSDNDMLLTGRKIPFGRRVGTDESPPQAAARALSLDMKLSSRKLKAALAHLEHGCVVDTEDATHYIFLLDMKKLSSLVSTLDSVKSRYTVCNSSTRRLAIVPKHQVCDIIADGPSMQEIKVIDDEIKYLLRRSQYVEKFSPTPKATARMLAQFKAFVLGRNSHPSLVEAARRLSNNTM